MGSGDRDARAGHGWRDLSCAEAESQLPSLATAAVAGVPAELHGEHSPLLRHLKGCAACRARYQALLEDLRALLDYDSDDPS